MLSWLYDASFSCFGLFCHQLPERSLFLFGFQFPLCIRCSAICLGALIGFAVLLRRARLPAWSWLVALAVPMGLEIGLHELGMFHTSNAVRATTGLLFGFGVFVGGLLALAAFAGRSPGDSVAASS